MIIFLSLIILIVGIILIVKGIRYQRQSEEQIEKNFEEKRKDIVDKIYKAKVEYQEICQANSILIKKEKENTDLLIALEKRRLDQERDQIKFQRSIIDDDIEDYKNIQLEKINGEIEQERILLIEKLKQKGIDEAGKLKLAYVRGAARLEEDFSEKEEEKKRQLSEIQKELEFFQSQREAVNQAILRQKELEEKEDFYKLAISKEDQEDIYALQNLSMSMHNREVIPKLIWELFIRRPTQEMIKRVVGQDCSGIYKITYIKTGEAYIGRTTSFNTRFQNHIKTALGLDACAHSTLHTRMAKDGIWNYTFEILEKVNKDQLPEKEKAYINLYGTKSQLNMKDGDSK